SRAVEIEKGCVPRHQGLGRAPQHIVPTIEEDQLDLHRTIAVGNWPRAVALGNWSVSPVDDVEASGLLVSDADHAEGRRIGLRVEGRDVTRALIKNRSGPNHRRCECDDGDYFQQYVSNFHDHFSFQL